MLKIIQAININIKTNPIIVSNIKGRKGEFKKNFEKI